jgi:hypothetical protein
MSKLQPLRANLRLIKNSTLFSGLPIVEKSRNFEPKKVETMQQPKEEYFAGVVLD